MNGTPVNVLHSYKLIQQSVIWLTKNIRSVQATSSATPVSPLTACFKGTGNCQQRLTAVTGSSPADSDNVKPHKLFLGLRCWVSAKADSKHAEFTDSSLQHIARVFPIIDRLKCDNENVVLLSFRKSAHSVVIIAHSDETYSYHSLGGRVVKGGVSLNLTKSDIDHLLYKECEAWKDTLQDSSRVYLPGMDVAAMLKFAHRAKDTFKFNPLTNNCSKYAAELMMSGFKCNKEPLLHDRILQMPANTLELAKEMRIRLCQSSSSQALRHLD